MAHFLFYIHFTGRQFYRTFEEKKRPQKRLRKRIPSMQRLNREHFYSSSGNSLFERSYNENADSPLTSIALEITVVIIIIQTRRIAIQRKKVPD